MSLGSGNNIDSDRYKKEVGTPVALCPLAGIPWKCFVKFSSIHYSRKGCPRHFLAAYTVHEYVANFLAGAIDGRQTDQALWDAVVRSPDRGCDDLSFGVRPIDRSCNPR